MSEACAHEWLLGITQIETAKFLYSMYISLTANC